MSIIGGVGANNGPLIQVPPAEIPQPKSKPRETEAQPESREKSTSGNNTDLSA